MAAANTSFALVSTLTDDKVKVPISKQLTDSLIIPFVVITGVALYDLYSTGQKRFDLNVLILLIFGVPTIIFAWLLLDKKTDFKKVVKVRKAERLIKLPIHSFDTYIYSIISSLLIFSGLGSMLNNNDFSFGLPLFSIGLTVFLFIAISLDHTKIWFKDSCNTEDDLERYKNTPKESFPAYQDGIFTYDDKLFTIQLEKEKRKIHWDDISLIRAYKVDQFTVDCIVIEIYSDETVITINDQTAGHMKFMEVAESKLLEFKKDWFPVVAFPAFETNLTTIYERQTADKKNGRH